MKTSPRSETRDGVRDAQRFDSSFAWADLVSCPLSDPAIEHTSALALRIARDLQQAG